MLPCIMLKISLETEVLFSSDQHVKFISSRVLRIEGSRSFLCLFVIWPLILKSRELRYVFDLEG